MLLLPSIERIETCRHVLTVWAQKAIKRTDSLTCIISWPMTGQYLIMWHLLSTVQMTTPNTSIPNSLHHLEISGNVQGSKFYDTISVTRSGLLKASQKKSFLFGPTAALIHSQLWIHAWRSRKAHGTPGKLEAVCFKIYLQFDLKSSQCFLNWRRLFCSSSSGPSRHLHWPVFLWKGSFKSSKLLDLRITSGLTRILPMVFSNDP